MFQTHYHRLIIPSTQSQIGKSKTTSLNFDFDTLNFSEKMIYYI